MRREILEHAVTKPEQSANDAGNDYENKPANTQTKQSSFFIFPVATGLEPKYRAANNAYHADQPNQKHWSRYAETDSNQERDSHDQEKFALAIFGRCQFV